MSSLGPNLQLILELGLEIKEQTVSPIQASTSNVALPPSAEV